MCFHREEIPGRFGDFPDVSADVGGLLEQGTRARRPSNCTRLRQIMSKLKRILCPVDFSSASRRALQFAVAMQGARDAQVTALHVGRCISLFPALVAGVEPAVVPFPQRGERALNAARFVEPFATPYRPIDIVFDEGNVADVIVATASRLKSDLIVIGTHGRGRLSHQLIGSVAADVVRNATCPVLVVGPACEVPPTTGGFRRIIRGPSASERRYAEQFAEGPGSSPFCLATGGYDEIHQMVEVVKPDLLVISRHSDAADRLMQHATYALLAVGPTQPSSSAPA